VHHPVGVARFSSSLDGAEVRAAAAEALAPAAEPSVQIINFIYATTDRLAVVHGLLSTPLLLNVYRVP
jgi:hypothetical protein